MKICHMTSAHPNLDKRIFYKECISLSRNGYETYIVAQGESFDREGVHIVGVPKVKRGRFERVLSTTKKVYKKALSLNADVYHIHDPELLPYAIKLKKKGKVVIFDSHEDFFVVAKETEYIPRFLRGFIGFIVSKYLNHVCPKLDVIISVTPHVCDKYKRINKNTYMITNYPVISNGEKCENKNVLSTNRTLVFAGGITKDSNHHKIINAISKQTDTKYVLCGFGEKSYIDSLKQLDGWKQVDYKGHIQYERVKSILEDSRTGIVIYTPNITTGYDIGTLGNTKIFEYMRAGLPIICTKFKLWEELIKEWKCGICVDPNNEDEIYSAIKYLMDNYESACEMGQNARKAVFQKYNWGTQEIILLEIYKNIFEELLSK